MLSLEVVTYLVLVSFFPSTLPSKCLGVLKDEEVILSKIDNKAYICFTPEVSKCFLRMKVNYPKLELNIDKLKELSNIYKKQIEKVVDINENVLARNELFAKEIASLEAKLEERDSFWSSPQLWFWVGTVIGGAVIYGSVELAKEL